MDPFKVEPNDVDNIQLCLLIEMLSHQQATANCLFNYCSKNGANRQEVKKNFDEAVKNSNKSIEGIKTADVLVEILAYQSATAQLLISLSTENDNDFEGLKTYFLNGVNEERDSVYKQVFAEFGILNLNDILPG